MYSPSFPFLSPENCKKVKEKSQFEFSLEPRGRLFSLKLRKWFREIMVGNMNLFYLYMSSGHFMLIGHFCLS